MFSKIQYRTQVSIVLKLLTYLVYLLQVYSICLLPVVIIIIIIICSIIFQFPYLRHHRQVKLVPIYLLVGS